MPLLLHTNAEVSRTQTERKLLNIIEKRKKKKPKLYARLDSLFKYDTVFYLRNAKNVVMENSFLNQQREKSIEDDSHEHEIHSRIEYKPKPLKKYFYNGSTASKAHLSKSLEKINPSLNVSKMNPQELIPSLRDFLRKRTRKSQSPSPSQVTKEEISLPKIKVKTSPLKLKEVMTSKTSIKTIKNLLKTEPTQQGWRSKANKREVKVNEQFPTEEEINIFSEFTSSLKK